jgi:hypothetical protein
VPRAEESLWKEVEGALDWRAAEDEKERIEDEKEIKLSIWAVSAPATMQMEGFSRQSLSKGLPKLRPGFLSAKVRLRPCPSFVSL